MSNVYVDPSLVCCGDVDLSNSVTTMNFTYRVNALNLDSGDYIDCQKALKFHTFVLVNVITISYIQILSNIDKQLFPLTDLIPFGNSVVICPEFWLQFGWLLA